jgi:anti-sigma factor RsiW
MVHDIDHGEFRTLLVAYSAGALSDFEWLRVHTHLSECPNCQDELVNLSASQGFSQALPWPAMRTVQRAQARPGWPVVLGVALVVALVAFSVGYAAGTVA